MKTKKLFLTAALLTAMGSVAQAESVGDTLVIEKVDKVKIETRDTVQRIVINGAKDDADFHYVQRISIPDSSAVRRTIKSVKDFNKITIKRKDGKPSKWEHSLHINLGMSMLTSIPDNYDFNPAVEIGLSWLADYMPYGKKNIWSVGLGLNYSHYGYDHHKYLDKDNNNLLIEYPCEDNWDDTNSSLSVSSLQVPIMYTHYFSSQQKWGISLGAILNWNFSSSASHHFELEGNRDCDVRVSKIGVRPFTIDGQAIVHIPSFPDIYCTYSPMTLFKDKRGPEVHQLSVGFYW